MLFYIVYLLNDNTNLETEEYADYIYEEIDKNILESYIKETSDIPDRIFQQIVKDLTFEYSTVNESLRNCSEENIIKKIVIDIGDALKEKSIVEMRTLKMLDEELSLLLEESHSKDSNIEYPNKLIIVTSDKIKRELTSFMKAKKLMKEVYFSSNYKTPLTNLVYEYIKLSSS